MMKHDVLTWASVLLLLLVSYSKSEAFSGYSGTEKAAGNSGTNRCYVFEKYFVQTWDDSGTAGEGIKVGRRHSLSSDRQCVITESNEVLVLNLDMGQWFAGISKDFLFVDYGTSGGGRGFGVYDLLTKKSIFTGNY